MPDEEVAEPSERELEMAKQLVESLSADFDPTKYHDEYREQLMELIEKKAAGEQIVAQPVVEEPGKVLDLMAALEASLSRPRGPEEEGEDLPPAAEDSEGDAPKKRTRRSRKTA